MAKKASLLRKAKKYGLDVTDANTVPQITEAIAKFEKENPPTPVEPTPTSPEAPEAPQNDEVGVTMEMTLEAPETPAFSLKEVLLTYNSINRSRRRWVLNRNLLRNHWKELYELLEKASGRDGGKAIVFDPNWHEVSDKGVVMGAMDRAPENVQIAIDEGVDNSAALEEAYAKIEELHIANTELKANLQKALEEKEIATNGTTKDETTTPEKTGEATETEETTDSTK